LIDQGATVWSGIQGLHKFGCYKERYFLYNVKNAHREPPTECYDRAKKYRIISAKILDVDLHKMRACLTEGYPFVFGFVVYKQEFRKVGKDGHLPQGNANFAVVTLAIDCRQYPIVKFGK